MSKRALTRAVLLGVVASSAVTAAQPSVASAGFNVGVDPSAFWRSTPEVAGMAPLIQATGSSVVRHQIYWFYIAPDRREDLRDPTNPLDPRYRWGKVDELVRATPSGAEPLLNPMLAPAWAEGPNRPTTGYGKTLLSSPKTGTWNPNPSDFNAFAKALAKRYDGTTNDPLRPGSKLPRVRLFEAWNEPNYQGFLTPQCSKGRMVYGNVCSNGGKVVATANYRQLLNAFYDGIKSVQPDATVTAGSFGPYGSSSQGFEIDPQVFARNLLCLGGTSTRPTVLPGSSCPIRAKLDALSFHPYTLSGTPTTKAASSNGGALGNAPDFRRALDLATSAGTILPAGPKELWETETGWMTCPPCRTTNTPGQSMGIAPDLAARYTAEMVYRAWSWGVQQVVWYSLIDFPGWPGGLYYKCSQGSTTNLAECRGATPTEAVAKPALSAFRFPIFAAKTSSTRAFSWVMSPCKVPGATVTFEVLNSRTKLWNPLNVPGPNDPKTGKPTSVRLALTLPAGTDGTIKSDPWAIPTSTSSIRATVSGAGCTTETSIAMPIASK